MNLTGALDQIIDEQLDHATPAELAGAYRALCGMMLVYSALAFRKRHINRNDDAYQKNAAKNWLASGGGVLTFPECCEAWDMNAGRAEKAIRECVPRHSTLPINRGKPGG